MSHVFKFIKRCLARFFKKNKQKPVFTLIDLAKIAEERIIESRSLWDEALKESDFTYRGYIETENGYISISVATVNGLVFGIHPVMASDIDNGRKISSMSTDDLVKLYFY